MPITIEMMAQVFALESLLCASTQLPLARAFFAFEALMVAKIPPSKQQKIDTIDRMNQVLTWLWRSGGGLP